MLPLVPHNIKNRVGETYGALTVIGPREIRNKNTYWKCLCACGVSKFINSGSLTSGRTSSCGCLRGLAPNRYKIQNYASVQVLKNMKTRCHNTTNKDFKYYGASGIIICDLWLKDSYSFYKWYDLNFEPGKTIDRIDNTQGYSPENCKFSSLEEQARNKRQWGSV